MKRFKWAVMLASLIVVALVAPTWAQDNVYLPLIQTGAGTDGVTVDAAAQRILDGYDLPNCTQAMYDELKKLPPQEPDDGKDPKKYKCKANIISVRASDLPPDAFLPPTAPVVEGASASAEAWRFAYHYWQCPAASCNTSQGVKEIYFNATSNNVSVYQSDWSNYHYQNKAVVGDSNITISCFLNGQYVNTFPLLALGIGQGNVNGSAYSGIPHLIYYRYLNGSCVVVVTDFTWYTNGNAALLTLQRCGSSQWKMLAAINGNWVVVRACGTEEFNYGRYFNAGVGIRALNGDIGNIHFKTNFYHKFGIYWHDGSRQPWYDLEFPSWAKNKSYSSYAPEITVMDTLGGEMTSLGVVKP